MIKFEDIMDEAARYLRGEMDPEEKAFFEALLEEYPHLQEDLRLMELVRLGIADLKEQEGEQDNEKQDSSPDSNNFLKKLTSFSPYLLLLILLGIAFWMYKKWNKTPVQDLPAFQFIRVNSNDNLQGQESVIIEQFGGDGDAVVPDMGHSVQWTPSGELVFGASFAGTGRLGPYTFSSKGQEDILFGSYKVGQGIQWMAAFGGDHTRDLPKDIAVDSRGNLLLTGDFGNTANFGGYIAEAKGLDNFGRHDFFIAKYSPEGSLLWMDHGGGVPLADKKSGVNIGIGVTVDQRDHVIVTGTYVGEAELGGYTLPDGSANENIFLIKYNPDGQLLWVKSITGTYMSYGFNLSTDLEGNIFMTGSFGHHNLGGQVYFGEDTLTSYGGKDIFLAKFDPNGTLIWVEQAGSDLSSNGYEEGIGLATDLEGNSIISGQFVGSAKFGDTTLTSYGGRDIFWAKYDRDGNVVWAHHAGSEDEGRYYEWAHSLDIDDSGNIYLTGGFKKTAVFGDTTLTTPGSHNFFVTKCDENGKVIWAKTFEIPDPENFQRAEGLSIDVNVNGDIVVTGYFSGSIQIGDKPLESQSKGDIFILIFNERGEIKSANSMIAYM